MLTISLINLESKLLLAGSDTAAWGSHASLARIFFQEIIRSFYATIVILLPPYLRDKRVKIASGQFSNENQPFIHYLISFPNFFNQFYFCSKSKSKVFIHFFFHSGFRSGFKIDARNGARRRKCSEGIRISCMWSRVVSY